MDSEFDRATAVTRQPDQLPGESSYAANLDAGWGIGGGLNGGYLLAVLGTAVADVGSAHGHPHPFVVNAQYLSAGRPGPATVDTRVLRNGRSLTTVAATLTQEQDGVAVPRLAALASYGDLHGLTDHVGTTAEEPDLPPRERCIPTSAAPAEFRKVSPLLDRFDLLADPACVGWALGEPSMRGMLQGWFRLHDDREPDPLVLLTAVDSLPPVTFDLGLPGWAPTLELTVHVRALPEPGWLKLRHATRNVAGGYFEEDCEVWDSAGRLVAQSRQLARMPRPQQG